MPAPMNEFDLDRAVEDAWVAFAERLSEVVSVMDPDGTLTLGAIVTEEPGQEPFVRFSCRPDRTIHTQASGNAVLADAFKLDVRQLQLLDELGWDAPSPLGEVPEVNPVSYTHLTLPTNREV